MVDRTICWCMANRLVVLVAATAVAFCGLWALGQTSLDAVPDVSDVQVIIATDWPGRSPDLVETQVTYPLVSALTSTARARSVRAVTDFGVSYIYVLFEDRTD